jgi:quercetin dioxygenase-like cupin family protein
MVIDLYQPFTNPITGETFRCLSSNEQAYITEWVVQPGGFVPFEHVHPAQDEVFHVKQGELRAVIDGRETFASAGVTLTIPRRARHIAGNNGPEALACVLEYRPGLDSERVFQCFGGLTLDGALDRRGLVHPMKMMYFMRKMNARAVTRPAYLPGPVFGRLMDFSLVAGALAGWEGLYRRYVE